MPLDHRSKLFDFTAFTALKAPRSKPPTRDNSKDSEYLRPLTQQWQILPTEIFERILDFLHADTQALISCSTVCHEWLPTSRYHLCTLLPVWPLALGQNCHKVNTAVALTGDSLLYGTNNGIYLSHNRALAKVLKLPAVSQIDALQSHDLLLVLSGQRLLVGPLHLATSSTPALLYRRLTVVSSDTSFFQVGDHAGKRVVCIVHSGRFSSHFKLMEVVESPAGAGTHTLRHLRSFYLPDRARSVHIWNKTIGASLRTGFQCVDPLSLVTFPVPVGPALPTFDDKKCRAMFRVDERFLLCYDRCAFYMNKAGTSFEADFAIRWEEPAKQFALAAPYLLAFAATGLRVWRIDNGVHAQTVHGANIRLLSAEPRILVKMGDGRILALRCAEPYVASVRERSREVY
ncbi:CNH domain-containing protein [Mycena albidolilacea]|uniref:CNH domain-containing protein n=1 Tax=Mycena albidolilacea TaxID=1033008 RepID=A0AAD7E6M4_9AGAR|nr:CNH domain-containing protein [Mycena albidolilacea]